MKQTSLIFLSLALFSCSLKQEKEKWFHFLEPKSVGIYFVNEVIDSDSMNVFKYRNFYNGAGVAVLDYDNDGRLDIYFCSNQGENKLYRNKGQLQFEDVTIKAGVAGKKPWCNGVAVADVNGDGWMDIYLSNSGMALGKSSANELFINNRDGTFSEQAKKFGLADEGMSTHAAFFDYDRDGDLDCYVLNNSLQSVVHFDNSEITRDEYDEKGGDKLFRNDDGKFVNVTKEAGIFSASFGFGLGISVSDVNDDGYLDLYISNDFFERDYLYINQKNGTFKDEILEQMGHISMASMGSDVADFNNDGWMDIFTTEMLPEDDYRLKTSIKFEDYDTWKRKSEKGLHHQYIQNALHLNNGNHTFSEISALAGVMATDWSWSALFFDFDNDGWKDIYVSNGIYKDVNNQDFVKYFSSPQTYQQVITGGFSYKEFQDKIQMAKIPNYAFLNQKNLTFKNVANKLGLDISSCSSGSAYGDLDNDGDLDLVVNNVNHAPFLFENKARQFLPDSTHYIKIKLSYPLQNHAALGSKISIFKNGFFQTFEVSHARGFQSSSSIEILAGLGTHKSIDSLQVRWINGLSQTWYNLDADTTYILAYDEKKVFQQISSSLIRSTWFKDGSLKIIPQFSFHEDNYIDFNVERLMPQMLSQQTPRLNISDINNDGLEDFILLTPSGNSTKLYLQNKKQTFQYQSIPVFEKDLQYDGADVAIEDFNGDGLKDIFVVYGGNKFNPYHFFPMPSLYLQKKKMLFQHLENAFSDSIRLNASTIRVFDLDNDGDKDVLMTSRSVPGFYGASPRLFVLKNDGMASFTDVTHEVAKDIQYLGMVNDVQMDDLDGDGKIEFVFAGDWFPVTICKLEKGQFRISQQIHFSGFVNKMIIHDIDRDGKKDIVLGNYGLNSKLFASEKQPMQLWINDFDDNGQAECFISYYKSDAKSYPLHQHDELLEQMPILKKRFLKYQDYAGVETKNIFESHNLDSLPQKEIHQLASGVLWQKKNNQFYFEPFPTPAQFSPIQAMSLGDFNLDGKDDLILHGNLFSLKPEIGRLDGLQGLVLTYDEGVWKSLSSSETGFFVKGEVSDIRSIKLGKNKNALLIAPKEKNLLLLETP